MESYTNIKKDDRNGNILQSGGILEDNNHLKKHQEGQFITTEFIEHLNC